MVEVDPKDLKGKKPMYQRSKKKVSRAKTTKSGQQGERETKTAETKKREVDQPQGKKADTDRSSKGPKKNVHGGGAATAWLWEGDQELRPEIWKELIDDERLGRPQLAVCSNFPVTC